MSGKPDRARTTGASDWLTRGGEMGKLIREMDWSKTPLGPIESWPQSLRTTVSLCLASNFPISIAWGPQRTQIYNDGYWPICGAKHPHSMGQDFRECWFSAWPAIGEAFERASAGETSILVNQRMFLDRNGYLEETFFSFSFSPIRDETGEVGGLFHPVTEMTDQTLAERRLKVLRDLADHTADAKTVEEACASVAAALGEHELDLPFTLLFLFDADGKLATLVASSGIQPGTAISPDSVDLSQESPRSWPLTEVARAGKIEEVDDLERRFGSFSCGPYPEPPKTAYALPIIFPGLEQTYGALVAGVSSRRALDDAYRTFYRMLSDSVSNALANARAYEEERKRAEAQVKVHRVRRDAEGALHESERRFREMIDAIPAAIYTTDAEGRLTHFNTAAVELSGRTPELGNDQWRISWKLYYPDGTPMPHDQCPMAVALKEGRVVQGAEAILERPDGARIWFEPYSTPLRDNEGRIVGGINMLVDITERKRSEDRLAQASRRLQAHVDNSPLAAVQFDSEWRITAWSEGAERMFGWSSAETLGKRIKDLRWVHEADADGVDALCTDMLTGQGLRYNHVNRNYRKDGSVIECEWYNSVLRDAKGKMVSLSSQVLDITERKRGEMNLAFLAEISHDLARLTSVDEIMRTVGAKIGEYLNLSLCAFIEINEAADEADVTHDWHRDDAPCLVGVYRIGDFVTSEFQEASRAGELFVVCDTGADPRANAGNFAALKVGSFVSAPLVRDGQWRFLFVACHSTAHDWRDDEIELIHELTTRIWTQLERVRTLEALRRSEERYRVTFDNAAVGIAHIGLDGSWLRFNDAVSAITGYSREELVTKTFADITHPDDIDADWALARRVLAGKIPTYSMEKRYLRKDGSIAWVCLTVSMMRDTAGAPQNFISVIEDIGERKLAEEALRKSEERFRAIVSQATAGIAETDLTGRFIFANQRYCEILGYSEAELRALRMRNIMRPDDLPADAEKFRILAEGGPDFVVEKRYVRKDGGEVWVNDSVSAVRDAAGRVRSIVAVTLDITERRRAEMALAEALALNRTITDNTQSCLWMMDAQGRGTFANPASEHVSGFKPEELIGQTLHEKVHHTHPDGTPFPIEECPLDNALPLREAVVGYEDVFVHKDGHFYPVRCAGRPIIVNGEPIGTVIEVQDITEERRAAAERERLLEEERRHARNLQLLNAASVAINAATSVEEVIRLIKEKARELTGARMAVVNLGLEGVPEWRGHGRVAGKCAPPRGWMAAPLLDGGGERIGVVQISDKWMDGKADEFTEADEALLWQLAQVASVALENQRLYEQEQEARQMAEQATRAKDEFLAMVSHELRSPLNVILGWNRLLRSRRGDDPQIAHVTETVESSGNAQLRLIEDLLDTARIISGKMRLETQPVELVAVITSALDAVRPAADSKGIAIVADLSHEVGQSSYQITGDPDRLQQVVWNLVSNAIKFTPEGGRVWVKLRRGGPGVQIIVRDTGQGISPDVLPYVFDRFKQGDSSVSRRFGGLGLGLALVKHLVELHGGSVMVESPGEGQGATFTVSLPVRAVKGDVEAKSRGEWETAMAQRALRSPRPATLSGVRALVIEDEAGARELITLTLEQHGALVTGVDSAAAALAALESQIEDQAARAPFDVLISDIGMPVADGYELIRRVRAHADERVSRIRAVALTAYARSEDRLLALRAGFHMHVPKPVDEAELTMVIAALTGRAPGHG